MSGIVDGIEALTQPITKLIEVVSKGIGILYEPTNIRRIAKAKAEEIEIISEAARKNLDLSMQYTDGKLMITSVETEDIGQRTALRQKYQEIQKQQNIESVIMVAAEQLKDEEKVSDEPVDEDWATRFFNIVGEVSSDEIQFIWGKILAGEIKNPGTFSYRTLETLRNLSQKDARVFSHVAGYVFINSDKFFVISDNEINKMFDLPFENILSMEECGLMSLNELNLNIYTENQKDDPIAIYNDKYICFARNSQQNVWNLTLHIYILTRAGIELYQIIDKQIQEQYSFACFNNLRKNIVETSVYEVIEILPNGHVSYHKENPISI